MKSLHLSSECWFLPNYHVCVSLARERQEQDPGTIVANQARSFNI